LAVAKWARLRCNRRFRHADSEIAVSDSNPANLHVFADHHSPRGFIDDNARPLVDRNRELLNSNNKIHDRSAVSRRQRKLDGRWVYSHSSSWSNCAVNGSGNTASSAEIWVLQGELQVRQVSHCKVDLTFNNSSASHP